MYLSDRDLEWAIKCGKLVFDPLPQKIDATSIDLHLDRISEAKIWDIASYIRNEAASGRSRPELRIGTYRLGDFGDKYLIAPPEYVEDGEELVTRRANQVIVRRGGFLLWQTREVVGTNPDLNADLICFVDGKSTRARAGILVHLTAPTIHTTWKGKITLEIVNLGPFDIVLQEGDVIAQLTVAKVTSPPQRNVTLDSVTFGQGSVTGRSGS
jgi:dCTP deaminase